MLSLSLFFYVGVHVHVYINPLIVDDTNMCHDDFFVVFTYNNILHHSIYLRFKEKN